MQKQLSGQFTALALVIYPFDFTFGLAGGLAAAPTSNCITPTRFGVFGKIWRT